MDKVTTPTKYLTSADVGAILGKSQRTVQRLVTDGRLRYAQKLPGPNGAYLFTSEAVEALLAKYPFTFGSAA